MKRTKFITSLLGGLGLTALIPTLAKSAMETDVINKDDLKLGDIFYYMEYKVYNSNLTAEYKCLFLRENLFIVTDIYFLEFKHITYPVIYLARILTKDIGNNMYKIPKYLSKS